MLFVIPYPMIDPVLIEVGPIAIRWYALAYVVGLLLGWRYVRYVSGLPPRIMTDEQIDDLLVWVTFGVILGGRLGYSLFYRPDYYVYNPLEILAVWQGGMSFHGGLVGVLVAGWIFSRRRGLHPLRVGDAVAAAVPIGLFLGRIANFINGELFGRPTDVPWAMVFPHGGPVPRHPSQLYESFLEGLVLFVVLLLLFRNERIRRRPGLIGGVFLAGYGAARIISEFFREPDANLGFLAGGLTMGMLLSVPLVFLGIYLILRARGGGGAPRLGMGFAPPPLLRRRIEVAGPISVAAFMAEALGHPRFGYYMKGDPFGRRGDFITAPEISQVFGELIGIWCASTWQTMGAPAGLRLVELGPGRGTLIADALRAVRGVSGFLSAITVHLVETSPALRARQEAALAGVDLPPIAWHAEFSAVPPGPLILVANEFFDALPIHQLQRGERAWHERLVDVADGRFRFVLSPHPSPLASLLPPAMTTAPVGAVAEVCPAAVSMVASIAGRLAEAGGAALVVDYGPARSAPGETLQALRLHAPHEVLADPGSADLTAHIDFETLARAASEAGAAVHGPVPQGRFLAALGLEARVQSLLRRATPRQREEVLSGASRLIDPAQMGTLFKALAITHPRLGVPAGFAA